MLQSSLPRSLFQFGLRRLPSPDSAEQVEARDAAYLPSVSESGLGTTERSQVCEAVAELADSSPSKKRRARGSYTNYSPADCAQIGRYAFENGNERARKRYKSKFPNLKESAIRNFKRAYKQKLDLQRKKINPKSVSEIPRKPRQFCWNLTKN